MARTNARKQARCQRRRCPPRPRVASPGMLMQPKLQRRRRRRRRPRLPTLSRAAEAAPFHRQPAHRAAPSCAGHRSSPSHVEGRVSRWLRALCGLSPAGRPRFTAWAGGHGHARRRHDSSQRARPISTRTDRRVTVTEPRTCLLRRICRLHPSSQSRARRMRGALWSERHFPP